MKLIGVVFFVLAATLVTPVDPAFGQFDLDLLKARPPGATGGFGDSRDRVKVSVKAAASQVAPGGDLPVIIVFDIEPGWHTWTNERTLPASLKSFEFAIHTDIRVEPPASEALEPNVGFLRWPDLHGALFDIGDEPTTYAVFEGRSIAMLPVTVPNDAPIGPATLTIGVTYQACGDGVCLAPTNGKIDLEVTIAKHGQPTKPSLDADFNGFPVEIFGEIRNGAVVTELIAFDLFGIIQFNLDAASAWGFALILLAAAVGGFMLNLTPCVLPVIPLKIMSLSQSASGSRGRTFALGAAMTVGLVGFWLVLGGLIAGVSGFTATNQLFQYPAFTIIVGAFIAVMAVGMCGLFSIRLPEFVYLINPMHETLHGSMIFGVLTAILSTPCTAPFMGAAAAWAATQHPITTLGTFAAIGAGMALPYLLLATFPRLVNRMPRTGPASELIKQVMGLLMLAAAAYFVGVGLSSAPVSPPDPPSRACWWFVGLFGVAAGGWLTWRTFRITPATVRRVVFGGLGTAIVLLSATISIRFTDEGPIDWTYYTPQRFAEAKSDGRVVFMEFAAEWCLNCKALNESVLSNERVVELLNGDEVVPIKVDLTGNNVMGNRMLADVNRLTVPLLVIFRADGTEVFKGDFYTVEQVIEAVEEAWGTGGL